MRVWVCGWLLLASIGCTSVKAVTIPGGGGRADVLVTTADLKEPYSSLGLVQVTRRGVLAFGNFDPAGTDLEAGLEDLMPTARAMGGDAVINVRFSQTQYTPVMRVVGAILFFIPLPSTVTITGEVIRRGPPPGKPPEAAPPHTL